MPCQKRIGRELANSFVIMKEGGSVQSELAAGPDSGGRPEPRWWFSTSKLRQQADAGCDFLVQLWPLGLSGLRSVPNRVDGDPFAVHPVENRVRSSAHNHLPHCRLTPRST
jgi:hypothetical protein